MTYKKHSVDDLHKELADKRESLRVFRFGGAGSRVKDVRAGRNLRKEIARLLTELNSRKVASTQGLIPRTISLGLRPALGGK